MEESLTFLDGDGNHVRGTLVRPVPPTNQVVVLCHGFMGFKDSVTNRALSELLAQRHIASFRFDFFGHGRSDGRLHDLLLTTLIGQAERALALMRGHGFTRVGLFGASFGGLVALLTASRDPSLVALALRCPVADFPAILRHRFGRVAVELWRRLGTVPPSIGHVPVHGRFYDDCLRYDANRAAMRLSVPTIIVHGGVDELIPVDQVQRLHQAIPVEKALHVVPGADHRFSSPIDFSRMTTLLAEWLARFLSLPASS
jgi:uncharacterized protein